MGSGGEASDRLPRRSGRGIRSLSQMAAAPRPSIRVISPATAHKPGRDPNPSLPLFRVPPFPLLAPLPQNALHPSRSQGLASQGPTPCPTPPLRACSRIFLTHHTVPHVSRAPTAPPGPHALPHLAPMRCPTWPHALPHLAPMRCPTWPPCAAPTWPPCAAPPGPHPLPHLAPMRCPNLAPMRCPTWPPSTAPPGPHPLPHLAPMRCSALAHLVQAGRRSIHQPCGCCSRTLMREPCGMAGRPSTAGGGGRGRWKGWEGTGDGAQTMAHRRQGLKEGRPLLPYGQNAGPCRPDRATCHVKRLRRARKGQPCLRGGARCACHRACCTPPSPRPHAPYCPHRPAA